MANYYTRTVITEPFLLTDDLRDVLTARGGELYPEGEKETVLDGIVHERPPLSSYSIVFEDGWNNQWDDVNEYIDDMLDDEEANGLSDEFKRMFEMEEHEILREILKVNPARGHIEEQNSWGCSKMRLDGFGGSGLIVNRKGFLYITSSNYEIDEDGIIQAGGSFTFWEEYDRAAAEHDADVEAANAS